MRLSRALLCAFLCFQVCLSIAQKIELQDLKMEGEEVQLTFTIVPDHSLRERYDVNIYASHNEYSQPLNVPIRNVVPNERMTINFSIVETIGYYQGELQFKLEAEATHFPVKVLSNTSKKLRKNKSYEVNWMDHNELGKYDIHLYHQDTVILLALSVAGDGFSGKLPKTIGPGNYQLVVSPSDNPDLASDDFPVAIKRNMKTFLALSAVLAGGTGFILLNSGGESGGGQLPDPPGTPN